MWVQEYHTPIEYSNKALKLSSSHVVSAIDSESKLHAVYRLPGRLCYQGRCVHLHIDMCDLLAYKF